MTGDFEKINHIPFTLDRGIPHRVAIGLIVLATDHTIEHEWRQIYRGLDGVAFYESRLWNDAMVTTGALMAMADRIAYATKLIRPEERIDVMAYGCSSGTIVIGEEAVFDRIRSERLGVACTSPVTAAIAGFSALGLSRIALLTPYTDAINVTIRDFCLHRGVEVPVVGSFTHENDNEVARIDAGSIIRGVRQLAERGGVDGVFISCTSLRVAHLVEEIESDIGLPVLSSNHAMAWHALRLGGYAQPVPGFGRLFQI